MAVKKQVAFTLLHTKVTCYVFLYSQTCFSDHLSPKTTFFFVSLENGFSLKHVLKEPVHKDHLSINFSCLPWLVFIDRFSYTMMLILLM